MFNENDCGVVSGLAKIQKMSQVESQIKQASLNKEDLFKTISLLEEKLKPICREMEKDQCIEEGKEPSLVPIAETIKNFGLDFAVSNNRIRSLIDRLEI